jgi:hypothetical protein
MAPHLTPEMFAIFATFATFAIFTIIADSPLSLWQAPEKPLSLPQGEGLG